VSEFVGPLDGAAHSTIFVRVQQVVWSVDPEGQKVFDRYGGVL